MKNTILPDALHPALKILRGYDAVHHTDFYETLHIYLKKERNIAETARQMHLHRNTLLYRLKRLEELVPADLDDDRTRLHLLLSFEIVADSIRLTL
ncbi:MAG: helix-turn-helix domain-containing protein [Clostridiales bacterium]|nr:helix-turn-helix domain-containing protein [Clostridiales bacterium]